jgi:hypothetical protein
MSRKEESTVMILLSVIGAALIGAFIYITIFNTEPRRNDLAELQAIKEQLKEAEGMRQLWNEADRSKNEADRVKYIVLTKKSYDKVIDQVNALRRAPYVEKGTGEFTKAYVFIEGFSAQAGQHIHDVIRRSKVADFK